MAKNINASHRPRRQAAGLVDLQIEGDSREASLRLDGLDKAFQPTLLAANFFFRRVHNDIIERIESRFRSEGDGMSGPWRQLAPYTEEMRAAGGFGPAHPINVRTGEMKRHLLETKPDIVPTSVGVTYKTPGDAGDATMQSKIRTAQIGGQQPGFRDTPPRPVLGLDETDLGLILMNLALHIADFQPGSGTGWFEA